MIKLRPYQVAARDAVISGWESGTLSQLIAMATGCGKTETFLSVLAAEKEAGRLGRALIIAHRRELVMQPVQRILQHWPTLGTPGIVMADKDQYAAPIVVATVQTLASNGRLRRILDAGAITHLVTDEAHHSVADSYMSVYASLPDVRHLGATATPRRTDDVALRAVFQNTAYRMSIKQAIGAGALSPFTALAVELPVSLDGVKESGDGWDEDELGAAMMGGGNRATADVLDSGDPEQIVVATWEKHARDAQTIAFCASVDQAHSLAARFRSALSVSSNGSNELKLCRDKEGAIRADG